MAKKKISASTPGRSYRKAMKILIARRYEKLWRLEDAVGKSTDAEAVHKMRVASRQLRAAMDAANGSFPKTWYQPLRKSVKEITSALGDARDADVQLELLQDRRKTASKREHSGIDRLIAELTRRREMAQSAIESTLDNLHQRGIRQDAQRRFGSGSRSSKVKPGSSAAKDVRQVVDGRIADLLQHAPIVHDASNREELHDMRIAAKRLRYTIELFKGVFARKQRKAVLDRLETMQELLGNVHDLDTQGDLVGIELHILTDGEIASTAASDPLLKTARTDRTSLLTLLNRIQKDRQARYEMFVDSWDRLVADGFESDLKSLTIDAK